MKVYVVWYKVHDIARLWGIKSTEEAAEKAVHLILHDKYAAEAWYIAETVEDE